jgi:colanic acid/amylovoran biosynthesis glycosyltransferase
VSGNETKKKVGYILKKFPVLSETFILNELLELERQGLDLHIFSLERPNDPRFHEDLPRLKANISYVPGPSDFNNLWKHNNRAAVKYGDKYRKTLGYVLRHGKPSLLWRFLQSCYIANQAKSYNIRHFHAHFATRPTSVASLTSMITGIPYSFTAHAMDIFKTRLSTRSLKKKLMRAQFVVTISDYNKQYLSQYANGDSEKIIKIYNGINLDYFKPNGASKRRKFTFLCVARFVEKKGHKVLIEACDILHRKGLDFQCWLVGKGRLKSSIKARIKDKQLGACVKILGPHSHQEVVRRCHKAHAYVLPCVVGSDGNRDGLPVSLVEALASGIPVITTPMTGNCEVVQENYNGLLVPFNDAQALARAMEKLMQDRLLYENLCRNTRVSVESRFDKRKTSKALNRLFQGSLI